MGFFSKDKPEDLVGVMFAAIIGFIDGFKLPVNYQRVSFNLAEIYILANWLQVVTLISAGGGATNRVMEVIQFYSKNTHLRALDYFVKSNRLQQSDLPSFAEYVSEHAPERRSEYDSTLRTDGNWSAVAAIALSHILNGQINNTETAQAKEVLCSVLISTGAVTASRLKKML